jgi:hypothetical protein
MSDEYLCQCCQLPEQYCRNRLPLFKTEADERIAELEARVNELEEALRVALGWNWLDDDMPPEDVQEKCYGAVRTRDKQALNRLRAKVLREYGPNIYNSGYIHGHHDTVEGQYVDIHYTDLMTYHAEEVAEIVAERLEAGE